MMPPRIANKLQPVARSSKRRRRRRTIAIRGNAVWKRRKRQLAPGARSQTRKAPRQHLRLRQPAPARMPPTTCGRGAGRLVGNQRRVPRIRTHDLRLHGRNRFGMSRVGALRDAVLIGARVEHCRVVHGGALIAARRRVTSRPWPGSSGRFSPGECARFPRHRTGACTPAAENPGCGAPRRTGRPRPRAMLPAAPAAARRPWAPTAPRAATRPPARTTPRTSSARRP